jgi:phage-related protein
MPEELQDAFGYALFLIQEGDTPENVKPLRGFGGAGVLEVVETHDSNAYRAVCTVRFEEAVYVLHCFEKKSMSGIATPKPDIDLVRTRLKEAEKEHERWKMTRP